MGILYFKILLGIFYLTIVFLHITKKNYEAVLAYNIQSLIIVIIMTNSYIETGNMFLLLIALLVLTLKVILANVFFVRLIKKYELTFSVTTYLDTPVALIFISVLTAIAHSAKFMPLTNIIPANHIFLSLALSAMFCSLFLIVNRKGALLQILSILSFENSVVAFSILAGLEQSPVFQLGIIFNIFVWLMVVTVFVSMIYKHYGTLDITAMRNLKD